MTDLILQPHPITGHTKPTKSPTKSNTKAKRPASVPHTGPVVVGTLQTAIKQVGSTWKWCKDGLSEDERQHARQTEERRQILCARIQNAETRTQWEASAVELDVIEGNDKWKQEPSSDDYNPKLIKERLRILDEARESGDIQAMMYHIRTSLSRDLGGMDNVGLYRHSYTGTKKLIERYVDSALRTIETVVTHSRLGQGVEHRDLLENILFARQSYGRSALLLSGGGTFGMYHIGVLKALFEAQLLPRIISGASAGSIVCAAMCTRTDEEIPILIKEFPYGDLAVFEDPDNNGSVLNNFRRLLTEGSWSDIKHLTRVMRGLMGDITFQEAYNRTRRILNICVSTASMYELPRLLNYVTAPNVMIWSAVAASCSVPLVFNAPPLLVKDPVTGEHRPWNPTPQHWIDGSVDNDLPMTRLSEMFNVNHFIVSQVNPHVVPFLAKDDHLCPQRNTELNQQNRTGDMDWVYTLTSMARDEALHRLHFLAELGVMPNLVTKVRSVLSQKYSGDINILPEISMYDLPRLLRNPSPEFMLKACLLGERATWPKMSRVRDRCAIELALDRAVHRLRARVVFSESQRDLRRLTVDVGNLRFKIPATAHPERPSTASHAENKHQKQPRRQSGSSVHILPSQWALLGSAVTDDDTEFEERLEMSRRQQTGSPLAHRKPRLKRASRSQIHIHSRSRLVSSPQSEDADLEFDFSKPMTPPFKAVAWQKPTTNVDAGSNRSSISNQQGAALSTGKQDNEPCYSSDEDNYVEDPTPYEAHRISVGRNKPTNVKGHDEIGPQARAGWVLWD